MRQSRDIFMLQIDILLLDSGFSRVLLGIVRSANEID